jgi:hypothetical protein
MKFKNAAIASALLMASSSASAGIITWNTPTAISPVGDTIVSTTGTLVEALNWGNWAGTGTRTINGVTFTGKGAGGITTNSDFSSITNFAHSSAVYTDGGVGGDFEALLDSFMWRYPGVSSPVSLSGLTLGSQYMVQFFVSDDRGCCASEMSWFSGGGNESDHVRYDLSYAVTGMFTADATTQALTVNGQYSSQVGGYQLRNLTTVPEPVTLAMFGLGLVGLSIARYRKKSL